MENKRISAELKNYGLVFIGAIVVALAFGLFIVPYKIVPGGVFGLGIVISELLGFSSVGIIALCINIPLLLFGTCFLGKKAGLKTAFFMILSSFLLDFLLMITKSKIIVNDVLLSSIFGGILVGITIFLVKKAGATTGGQDIIARILSPKINVDFNKLILIIDAIIIVFGVFTFGDYTMATYCLITIIATSKTIEHFMKQDVQNKTVLVFSKKNHIVQKNITNNKIIYKNLIKIIHKDSDEKMILITKNNKNLSVIEAVIYNSDPEAQIITLESNFSLGNI
ncbi:YitT family protein [Tenacibaculum ovolyticum]|uniref:YitT family protein n=1 Tax=Tenacibaculum ovolyticum TaxID=104270 RepID=UPI0022F3A8C0|nr:YitT family protein [Tenacibaculum ovolyticum]WBX78416.1 YitT family protein [Tenacibaculum ovolyticum]